MKSNRKIMTYGLMAIIIIETGALIGIGLALPQSSIETTQNVSSETNYSEYSESEGPFFQGNGTIVYEWTGSSTLYYIRPDYEQSNVPDAIWHLIPLTRLPEEFEQDGLHVSFEVKYTSVYGILHQGLTRKDIIVELLEIEKLD